MRHLFLVLAVVLLAAGLAGQNAPESAAGQPPPPLDMLRPAVADAAIFLPLVGRRFSTIPPLNVTPAWDGAGAVSQEAPPAGGVLSRPPPPTVCASHSASRPAPWP